MRDRFISDLVAELMGPREGIRERIIDPMNEYLVGVLSPKTQFIGRDPDSEGELASDQTEPAEEETYESEVTAVPVISAPLRPDARPCSMGLMFSVMGDGFPEIDVCITWARYFRVDHDGGRYQRFPRFCTISSITLANNRKFWIDKEGKYHEQKGRVDPEVSLTIRVQGKGDGRYYIYVFLVNEIIPKKDKVEEIRVTPEDHIFQPQVRVICSPRTKLVSLDSSTSATDEEEMQFAILYANRPVLAKGLMCSAVWKDVDPAASDHSSGSEGKGRPPFRWVDGELLPEPQRTKFSLPDVRTEFIPVVSTGKIEVNWDTTENAEAPVLEASKLSEMFDPTELQNALRPLMNGYAGWIQKQRDRATLLPEKEKETALKMVSKCEEALRRMEAGLQFLLEDSDARLSFCFANKALDLQQRWYGEKGFVWRPFQIAFLLTVLEPALRRSSEYRRKCDLLWVPTGAGKTEAYLALIACILSHRRRRALGRDSGDKTGHGVAAIMRYTLRLLTIQQFRRALNLITACEVLRVEGLGEGRPVGWRPESCNLKDDYIWGSTPFSVGLWIGGGVTPNSLETVWIRRNGNYRSVSGALDVLKSQNNQNTEADPAQVFECPACRTVLAVDDSMLSAQSLEIFWVMKHQKGDALSPDDFKGSYCDEKIKIVRADLFPLSGGYFTVELRLELNQTMQIRASDVDTLARDITNKTGAELIPFKGSRPGYFGQTYITARGKAKTYDFMIFCPNPKCPLHRNWIGGLPSGLIEGRKPDSFPEKLNSPDGNGKIEVPHAFRRPVDGFADRIPIPALTVDDQIYHRIPSLLIATVDKFARPAYEPRASAIFGNVNFHHSLYGFYRLYEHNMKRSSGNVPHPSPANLSLEIAPLDPPDVIIQDELHLIEGPLGSMVGFYETAVDMLCVDEKEHSVYYIASTATVRKADSQVRAIFNRDLSIFPPLGIDAGDRFFVREKDSDMLDDRPGDGSFIPARIYVGVCVPGRSAQYPLGKIISRLLQTAHDVKSSSASPEADYYWTLVLYFNAIKELGGARSVYRQDVRERLNMLHSSRDLDESGVVELSSRTPSRALPALLSRLESSHSDSSETPTDAVFTTSIFGTGVDVPRLSLMLVDGQPKTTTSYIQSSGRVGRRYGGLVITFLRASRPRDLSHYEFFIGYHRQIHRYVEPPVAAPFSPGVLSRATAALCTFVLRNGRKLSKVWYPRDAARLMETERNGPDVTLLVKTIKQRLKDQPSPWNAMADQLVNRWIDFSLDRWKIVAAECSRTGKTLHYDMNTTSDKNSMAVLGNSFSTKDDQVVFPESPLSLRGIEPTIGVEDGAGSD